MVERDGGGRGGGVQRVTPDALAATPLAGYATVFLANALPLDGQAILNLEQYVREGGVLALFPGDSANPAAYGAWSVLPAKPAAVRERITGDRVRTLRLVRPDDLLFADFELPPGAVPSISIQRHLEVAGMEPKGSTVISAGMNRQTGMYQDVEIKPAVEFRRLEEVVVILE